MIYLSNNENDVFCSKVRILYGDTVEKVSINNVVKINYRRFSFPVIGIYMQDFKVSESEMDFFLFNILLSACLCNKLFNNYYLIDAVSYYFIVEVNDNVLKGLICILKGCEIHISNNRILIIYNNLNKKFLVPENLNNVSFNFIFDNT